MRAHPLAANEAILKSMEIGGETIVASGAAEANALGLTTQVPIREIFLTSGRSRTLRLGNREIELKHGSRWLLSLGNQPAGRAIRALSWLGPEQAPAALKVLRTQLPVKEWHALQPAMAAVPSWMARLIGEANKHA